MDQQSGTGMGNAGRGSGSEDASEARDHVRAAEENRDALAAQNRRTEATAPGGVETPIGNASGLNASGTSGTSGASGPLNTSGSSRASGDASEARENVRAAEENRDALADESRRVQASAPPDVDTGR